MVICTCATDSIITCFNSWRHIQRALLNYKNCKEQTDYSEVRLSRPNWFIHIAPTVTQTNFMFLALGGTHLG